jgi:hypothetical protein
VTVGRLLILTGLGAVLGVMGARFVLVGSGLSLLPWAVAAVLIGLTSPSYAGAIKGAARFGFALAFAFMLAGYDGQAALASRLLPFALLGLVGALCATLIALGAVAVRPAA